MVPIAQRPLWRLWRGAEFCDMGKNQFHVERPRFGVWEATCEQDYSSCWRSPCQVSQSSFPSSKSVIASGSSSDWDSSSALVSSQWHYSTSKYPWGDFGPNKLVLSVFNLVAISLEPYAMWGTLCMGSRNQREPGLGRDYSTKKLVLTFSPFAAMHLQMRPQAWGCWV